ncbi:MAG: hypothetical protein AABW81_02055 [Nanoarchaeota archaeon]
MLTTKSISPGEKGSFPPLNYNRIFWEMYGSGLISLLKHSEDYFEDSLIMKHVKNKATRNIKELDRTLELIRNYHAKNDSDPWVELFYSDNKFPKKSDIHKKFLELLKDYMNDKEIINKQIESKDEAKIKFYKIHYNLVMDCRRVIDYILNDKPLYLIPEQVKTFRNFASELSKPLEERRYYFS